MSYSLELQFDEPLTVGQVARYLELLRSAGATDDTVLDEVHPYQDESLLIGWTYKTETLPAPSDRAELTLPAPVVRDAIDMLDSVADSDGDVRSLLDAAEGVRSTLRKAIAAELGFPEVSTSGLR
ncbi:hypothetical protein SAMN05421833_12950 [Microbispora rosea]|uniref:Uncharacterized protein n=1 Tax=Microbispora rosea TaxID=58117 RepID=A0A1N7GI53_9ACTN|nr:hypothetical protein [Microbispora rosea]GIH51637.1 hypothetical protein Mro03_68160 [Microbispora rosea subsp. rosea]SIS12284.1 hypothetical protein SAMN05421833_12950 [Microbispora rosea]